MSYDNIKSLTMDEPPKPKSESNGSTRSSIKSMLSKKFHPHSSTNSSPSHEPATTDPPKPELKPKKRRTSFRHFSQFLKRSHSTNTDLSKIVSSSTSTNADPQPKNPLTADLIYQRLHAKPYDEPDSSFITRSNTSIMCNSGGSSLVPISEEENPVPVRQSDRLRPNHIDEEDYYYDNNTRSDSGALTQQQTQRIAPSLSTRPKRPFISSLRLLLGLSSSSSFISAHTSSPSGVSSTSNRNRNVAMNNHLHQVRDDSIKPSKSSSSVTSNIGTALAVLAKNNQEKHFLSNSISLHGDVSTFINTQLNNHHASTSAINDNNASSATNNGKGRSLVAQNRTIPLLLCAFD